MKKSLLILIPVFLILCLTGVSFSSPVYWTFEGEITNIENDFSRAEGAGLSVGSQVQYVVVVDTEINAYTSFNDIPDIIYPLETSNSAWWTWQYYAGYVGGDALTWDGDIPDTSTDLREINSEWTEVHRAVQSVNRGGMYYGSLVVDISTNICESIYIATPQMFGGMYPIGSIPASAFFNGYNKIYNIGGEITTIFFDLNIVSQSEINPVAPVPEPSTIILLSTGLLGLIGASRKKFKK